MLGKIFEVAGTVISKAGEVVHSEPFKKIATQVAGGVASAVAVKKVKDYMAKDDAKKQAATSKGLSDEDTKQVIGFMA